MELSQRAKLLTPGFWSNSSLGKFAMQIEISAISSESSTTQRKHTLSRSVPVPHCWLAFNVLQHTRGRGAAGVHQHKVPNSNAGSSQGPSSVGFEPELKRQGNTCSDPAGRLCVGGRDWGLCGFRSPPPLLIVHMANKDAGNELDFKTAYQVVLGH